MLRENKYIRDRYLDELEVAKGKELKSASCPEEKPDIEERYNRAVENDEERYQTFKGDPYFAKETEAKIDMLRDSFDLDL